MIVIRALTEKIVSVLPKMKCPYQIEPHQIQGLDYIHVFPVIQVIAIKYWMACIITLRIIIKVLLHYHVHMCKSFALHITTIYQMAENIQQLHHGVRCVDDE